MSFNVVKDLSKMGTPYPKQKRVVNKKVLNNKKHICEFCGREGETTHTHHIKTKGSRGR